jgi:hypothetical protein
MTENDKQNISWDQNLSRVTSFLTTNGQIQIQLCGLFITSIAFLTAFSEKIGGNSNKIFLYIVPIFSILIFSLSFRVYVWVSYQLTYLSIFGKNPKCLKKTCTYESYKELILKNGNNVVQIMKLLLIIIGTLRFLIYLPFRLNNIYYLYFLLYIITIPLSVFYASKAGTPWDLIAFYLFILFIVLLVSIKDYIYLEYFKKDIKNYYLTDIDEDIPIFD